uniref:Uncharacterized protein n=1 Tax=Ditylum brightwellii TaxID=49249 RepID=A0A7S4QN26_9STRA
MGNFKFIPWKHLRVASMMPQIKLLLFASSIHSFVSATTRGTTSAVSRKLSTSNDYIIDNLFGDRGNWKTPKEKNSINPDDLPNYKPVSSITPSALPSTELSSNFTLKPSVYPTNEPINVPSAMPPTTSSSTPSDFSASNQSKKPNQNLLDIKASVPSSFPSTQPSDLMTSKPSLLPSMHPIVVSSLMPSPMPSTTQYPFLPDSSSPHALQSSPYSSSLVLTHSLPTFPSNPIPLAPLNSPSIMPSLNPSVLMCTTNGDFITINTGQAKKISYFYEVETNPNISHSISSIIPMIESDIHNVLLPLLFELCHDVRRLKGSLRQHHKERRVNVIGLSSQPPDTLKDVGKLCFQIQAKLLLRVHVW